MTAGTTGFIKKMSTDTIYFFLAVYMGFIDRINAIFSKSGKRANGRGTKKTAIIGQTKAEKLPADLKSQDTLSLEAPQGKLRRQAEQITAAPIDEETLGFSVSIKNTNSISKKRNAIRIRLDKLEVFIPRLKKRFPATDISASGIAFAFAKPRFKGGVKLEMDLLVDGEVKARKVLCKVMRHERGTVGCAYVELDRTQDDIIHALVLLGQKQLAKRKNKEKDNAFNLPEESTA